MTELVNKKTDKVTEITSYTNTTDSSTCIVVSQPNLVGVANLHVLGDQPKIKSVVPSSVSPVFKSTIAVTLSDGYVGPLSNKDDFGVSLITYDPKTNVEVFVMDLYILSVDPVTKTIYTKFGGHASGNYKLRVTYRQIGRLNADGLFLVV